MGRSRSRSRSRERYRRRSRSYSRSLSPEGVRLHVADLGVECSKREIEHRFQKFGDVLEVWLARNPPCFAFVVFRNREDAEEALREIDGTSLCGYRVRVSLARPRVRGGRAQRNIMDQRCYQCGVRGHFSRDCEELRRIRFSTYRRSVSRDRDRRRRRSRTRSRSPRRRRRHSRSISRSRSRTPRRNRKRSRGSQDRSLRQKSPSKSKSRSRSPSPKARTVSRSRSVTPKKPQSASRSRSRSKSISRSRSRSVSH